MNNKITVNAIDNAVAEYLTKRGVMSYKATEQSFNIKA